jgi:hypothetical protein
MALLSPMQPRVRKPYDVFVWKSYGDISVIDVRTVEGASSVYEDMMQILNSYGEPYTTLVTEVREKLEGEELTVLAYRRAIQTLLEAARESNHDSFESGTGFYHIKETT